MICRIFEKIWKNVMEIFFKFFEEKFWKLASSRLQISFNQIIKNIFYFIIYV
jgi:hypothetical protein